MRRALQAYDPVISVFSCADDSNRTLLLWAPVAVIWAPGLCAAAGDDAALVTCTHIAHADEALSLNSIWSRKGHHLFR